MEKVRCRVIRQEGWSRVNCERQRAERVVGRVRGRVWKRKRTGSVYFSLPCHRLLGSGWDCLGEGGLRRRHVPEACRPAHDVRWKASCSLRSSAKGIVIHSWPRSCRAKRPVQQAETRPLLSPSHGHPFLAPDPPYMLWLLLMAVESEQVGEGASAQIRAAHVRH